MKSRLANALVLAALVAFAAGCPAKPPTAAVDEEKTSRTVKGKSPAPATAKSAAPTGSKPSTAASTAAKTSPAASVAPSTAASTSVAPSTAASAAASVAPSAAPSVSASAEDAPTAVTVLINQMQFLPGRVTVKQGGGVTFINRDTAPHTVKPDGHTAFTESPSLASPAEGSMDGGVFNATFPTAGEFKYICGIHGSSMSGTVVVVP